jgi:hypothetical protein
MPATLPRILYLWEMGLPRARGWRPPIGREVSQGQQEYVEESERSLLLHMKSKPAPNAGSLGTPFANEGPTLR